MTLIADIFSEIPAPKNMVRQMSKKPCFRWLLDTLHGKLVDTMLQSEWERVYKIYQSLWRKFHWKKPVLGIYKIIRLFVNTLTVDDKHYLLNSDNLTQPIQMQLYRRPKSFAEFYFCILKIYIKFETFAKKGWPSYLLYFGKSWFHKIWLDKCLKSRVLQDP